MSLLISPHVRAMCQGDRAALGESFAEAAAATRRRAPAGDDVPADAKRAAYLAYLDVRAAAGLPAREPSAFTVAVFGLD